MNPHNKRVFENLLYSGLGLCLLGFLLAVSKVATVFGVICFGIGVIIFVISLCYRFVNAPLPNTPTQEKKEEKTTTPPPSMIELLNSFMNIAETLAKELNRTVYYEKNREKIEWYIMFLQKKYGYQLNEHSDLVMSVFLYFIYDTDSIIYHFTQRQTKDSETIGILDLIRNNLQDIENAPSSQYADSLIHDLVAAYFSY